MARYKIGIGNDVWDFEDAYQAAKNGDILEFSTDFWYTLSEEREFIITKHLTFIGESYQDDSGLVRYTNVIRAKFVLKNNANVTFQNLWFNSAGNRNIFYVTETSTLNLVSVVFNNEEIKDYPLIYSDRGSVINLNAVEVKYNENDKVTSIKTTDGALININDSHYLACQFILENARGNITNSVITYHNGNVLLIRYNSEVIFTNSTIVSNTPIEKNFPAIWLENSKFSSENSKVVQEQYLAAISVIDRSVYSSKGDIISSVSMTYSIAYLDNTTIEYGIYAEQKSHIIGHQGITFLGNLDSKIDLLLSNDSTIIVDEIELNRFADPNIRLKERAFAYIEKLYFPNGNTHDIKVEVDDSSQLVRAARECVNQKDDENDSFFEEACDELDPLQELNNLIGLKSVKQTIDKMITQVEANRRRLEKGMKPLQQTLHAVFVGNPGTGKTTVARLLGKVLFQYGALSGEEFKFVEVSEPDLISQNVGGTAIQTKQYLDEARGGVLFIDEAYTLNKKGGSVNFGQEAIDTIMKYMEDYREEIMVIFAGYTKEIEQFLKTNPGLVSRAPNRFIFEDFTAEEIIQLGEILLEKDQFVLEDKNYYAKQVAKAYNASLDRSNGRWIRNFNEQITKEQLNRIVKTNSEDIVTVLNLDIDNVLNQGKFDNTGQGENAVEQLNKLIGIHKVKRQVQEFIYQVEANQKKEEMGIKVTDFTLHSLFLGNPGTGKTTVARIIGKILYQKGLIPTNKFIEASRSDFVAGYIGHTALKTREVLESALGGVLFIDEAYTLNSHSDNDFGKEAIEEILKFMEDHRRDVVIIFAGYTTEMEDFLQMNSGLTSRIPTIFDFEDYTIDEIIQIGLLGIEEYNFDRELYASSVAQAYSVANDRSNGRWIRNFNEKLLRIQSARLIQSSETSFDTISNEDIELAKGELK